MSSSTLKAPGIEEAVLGSLLLFPKHRKFAFSRLKASDFTTYKEAFEAFKFFWDQDGELDPIEIEHYINQNGNANLSIDFHRFIKNPSVNIENSINTLKELSRKRKIRSHALQLDKAITQGEPISEILEELGKLRRNGLPKEWFNPVNPFEAPVEPLHWIIEGFSAKGMITLLGGEAGSGKSILIQYVLQLRDSQSLFSTKGGKGIFLTGLDSSETELRRRAKSIGAGNGLYTVQVPDDIVPFATNEEFMEELKEEILKNEVDTIVFDTLADFHSGNLYEASEANDTMKAFRRLARVTGVAVILITHTRKSADSKMKYSVNDIADSRIFGTKSDFVFGLKSEYQNSANLTELQCLKSRSPKPLPPKRILIEFDESRSKLNIENTERHFTSESERLKKELEIKERREKAWELKKQGMSIREIGRELEVSHPTISSDLKAYEANLK